MIGRRYVKRTWRVPKDQGAANYFAALLDKMLRKHGWPVSVTTEFGVAGDVIHVRHLDGLSPYESDFGRACQIASRNLSYAYNLKLDIPDPFDGSVFFLTTYVVFGNVFKEARYDTSRKGPRAG